MNSHTTIYFALIFFQTSAMVVFPTGKISFVDASGKRESCDDALAVEISEISESITFCRLTSIPAGKYSSRINDHSGSLTSNSTEFDFFHGKSKISSYTANCISNSSTGKIMACSVIDEVEGMIYQIARDDTGVLKTTASHSSEFPTEVKVHRNTFWQRLGLRGSMFHMSKQEENNMYKEDGSELGVLVTWTKTTECVYSGNKEFCDLTDVTEENMRTMIALSVAETNVAFELSGVKTSLKLVHSYREETDSPDSGISDALCALRNPSDGIYDDVHVKRKQYGGDLVVMIHSDTAYCGVGLSGPSKNHMFSATSYMCAVGNLSFAHEIGHNLGAEHDRDSEGCTRKDKYNYGFRNHNANLRTIMAYDCGNGCVRVQRFSNTNALYHGKSIGDAFNDNARQINDVRVDVANYF